MLTIRMDVTFHAAMESALRPYYLADDPSHDFLHVMRVVGNFLAQFGHEINTPYHGPQVR